MKDVLSTSYLDRISKILKGVLGTRKYKVYLFGSRARGDARLESDFDIGILADDPLRRELSIARRNRRCLCW